jgi:NADH-quinone oxidoreductase subunit C
VTPPAAATPAATAPAAPAATPAAPKPAAPAVAPKPAAPAAHAAPVGELWERDPVSPEWKDSATDPLVEALKEEFGEAIESARSFAGELTLVLRAEAVARIATALKAKHQFTYLIDICGADYPKRTPRFDVVYHLHSFAANRRIRLKVVTDEATPVPTVCGVWRAANWSEREVYDMYGVTFADHPDMTRILLWEGFNGFPLRKDFPVEGIDTGAAIYPEYYEEKAGPVAGTGTGWKPAKPPAPPAPPKPAAPAVPAAAAPATLAAPVAPKPAPAAAPPAAPPAAAPSVTPAPPATPADEPGSGASNG